MSAAEDNFEARTMKLFRGNMADYSKLIKIMQYISVLTSEYGLYRYHLRGLGVRPRLGGLVGGARLSEE